MDFNNAHIHNNVNDGKQVGIMTTSNNILKKIDRSGERTVRKYNNHAYAFVFSSEVKDWYTGKAKQIKYRNAQY